jgi:pyruvate,water dikinase
MSLTEQRKCPICGSGKIEIKKIDLEADESNPMIGFRGASRYVSKLFREAFILELKAFVKVHQLGLTNAIPMVPFVRTIAEADMTTKDIKEIFKTENLKLPDIIFMAEIPSICIIPKEFSMYCDGFSIGSNDLTQLTLGIDRDCEVLAWEFDESNHAVTKSIEMLCEGAHSMEPVRTVGICGQAPSDLGREFIKFLVMHLDSIGVNPDKVAGTLLEVKEIEDELKKTIKDCEGNSKKLSKELGIFEINANYLIKKLSK